MDFLQIIMTPFSWLLRVFCQVFDSYGIALILFTIVVKLILFPFNLKAKKSMIKMNLISGQLKEIQKRCGNDRERYNQEVQKFYSENNVSPMGGCGWSLLPLVILYPLYAIIRRPFRYMMNLTDNQSGEITLEDADGNTLVSYTPMREYNSVVISCAELSDGSTYTIHTGENSREVTMEGLVYTDGEVTNAPGQGNPPDTQNGDRPQGDAPQGNPGDSSNEQTKEESDGQK